MFQHTQKTGSWNITEKFKELIDVNKLDKKKLEKETQKYKDILSEKINTKEEEYDMFIRYYDGILNGMNIKGYTKNISEKIAYDRTYNTKKIYTF